VVFKYKYLKLEKPKDNKKKKDQSAADEKSDVEDEEDNT
jgi:hypothetical protein